PASPPLRASDLASAPVVGADRRTGVESTSPDQFCQPLVDLVMNAEATRVRPVARELSGQSSGSAPPPRRVSGEQAVRKPGPCPSSSYHERVTSRLPADQRRAQLLRS